MIGAGTIINPIIKILTTVAILAAVYFFFVKPALDTTENITDSFNESFGSFDSIDDFADEAQELGIDVNLPDSEKQQEKLVNCIEKADGDNAKQLERCAAKFAQ